MKRFSGIFLALFYELCAFVQASVISLRHKRGPFAFHGLNPPYLPECPTGEVVLLLHGDGADQSIHMPMAKGLQGRIPHPVYSVDLRSSPTVERIGERISQIRAQHAARGRSSIKVHLVGHSLGAILGAEYVGGTQTPGTRVDKFISIAGRLRLRRGRWPCLWRHLMERVARTQRGLKEARVTLYSIAAEWDWLVPHESVAVAPPNRHLTVPNRSHLSVLHAKQTHDQIIEWLTAS